MVLLQPTPCLGVESATELVLDGFKGGVMGGTLKRHEHRQPHASAVQMRVRVQVPHTSYTRAA